MMSKKYLLRKLFEKQLSILTAVPRFPTSIGIMKKASINNEDIILDEIEDEKIVMWYFKNSDIGKVLYYNGFFEKDEISLIKHTIQIGDTVLDIGANIGYHTLTISKATNGNAKIFSFEPFSKNFLVLKRNIRINNLKNVQIYKLAIGDKKKRTSLKVFEDYAYNSFLDTKRKKYLYSERVEMDTIDNFVLSNNLHKVDFIKIDVEGYEFNVLKGAKRTLERFKPKIICEIYQQNLESLNIRAKDVVNYVVSFGYNVFTFAKGEIVPLSNKLDNYDYYNFYFEKK